MIGTRKIRRIARAIMARLSPPPQAEPSYQPVILLTEQIDLGRLQRDVAALLGMDPQEGATLWADYHALAQAKGHPDLGEYKTLSTAEAFAIFALMHHFRPAQIVEIGTQHGKSTRRIIDMAQHLGLDAPITCYDIEDNRQYFSADEATLVLKDVTYTFATDVLDQKPAGQIGLIYLDAHPYHLLKHVIEATLKRDDWVMAVHDCGAGLCNPHMTIPRDRPELITSRTGTWERHALADLLGIPDPLSPALDDHHTATHRMRVLGTQHGLAVIVPDRLARTGSASLG